MSHPSRADGPSVAFSSLFILLAHSFTTAVSADIPERPNVLLIVADDLGWSDVGWHGGPLKTPRMDRLVREGIELTQHYVQPVCTPTRTALMTGRYPGRFGPQALAPSNRRALPPGTETIATWLRSKGYATHLSGKWHLGSRVEWGPLHYGFDHAFGTLTGAADPWTHKYRPGPYEETWHRDHTMIQPKGNTTELVAEEVRNRLENAKQPWFIYVPFHAVHTPVDAPDEFKAPYKDVHFHDDPAFDDSKRRLAAMVSQLDAKIGEFVDILDQTGQRERTLVLFTSDNGGIESLKNAYVGNVPDSPLNSENDPLRGQKNTLYEGGVRVCAFAHWKSVLSPGKFETPMHVVDWFPTIRDIVDRGTSEAFPTDGISQWKALLGLEKPNADRPIYIAMRNGSASLRKGEWKIITRPKGKTECYRISVDPYEKQNLADQESEMVKELQAILAEEKKKDSPNVPEDLRGYPD